MSSNSQQIIKIKPVARKKKKEKEADIYFNNIITRTVYIPITNVGRNLERTLKSIISDQIEGKCIVEGYIKYGSVNIISYSNGVQEGYNIIFEVVVECSACNPVEGMIITCFAKNITKAGIRAEVAEENNPIVIFIARDHNYLSKSFSMIEAHQEIKIRVIGQRFELNDKYISVIGELIDAGNKSIKTKIPITVSEEPMESELPIENELPIEEKEKEKEKE